MAFGVAYCDIVWVMNSVSRVACIRAGRLYVPLRSLNPSRRACEMLSSRCDNVWVSRAELAMSGLGTVVEISACTITSNIIAAYTYGLTWSGRLVEGSQPGALMPSLIVVV